MNNNSKYTRIAIWPKDAKRLKRLFPKKEGNTQQSAMKKLLDNEEARRKSDGRNEM